MEYSTIITSIISSLGVSVSAIHWLGKGLISHKLEKDLEQFKNSISEQTNKNMLEHEALIKQKVEAIIEEQSEMIRYRFEAKKRLYNAIGPLRLQLLMACRDASSRIGKMTEYRYELSKDNYYSKSTIYTFLKPLCISELIERQISYADFSIDEEAIKLLKFKKNAFMAFSGGYVIETHPNVDWERQKEHVVYGKLAKCVNALIKKNEGMAYDYLRYDEFDEKFESLNIDPFPKIIEGFTPKQKPIFWARLITFGNLCNELINELGVSIGFEKREFKIRDYLLKSNDLHILDDIDEYVKKVELAAQKSL